MTVTEPRQVSRSEFMRSLMAGIAALIGAALGAPSIAYLFSPAARLSADDTDEIAVGPLDDFPIGTPTRVEFTRTEVNGWERTATNYGMYVVRLDDRNVRIFSDICTHLACRVSWHPELGHYVSPCHDGHFDLLGGNVSGPPPRPLDEYAARLVDGQLFGVLPPFRRSA